MRLTSKQTIKLTKRLIKNNKEGKPIKIWQAAKILEYIKYKEELTYHTATKTRITIANINKSHLRKKGIAFRGDGTNTYQPILINEEKWATSNIDTVNRGRTIERNKEKRIARNKNFNI